MKITNIREIEVQAAAGRELLLPKTVEVELEGGIIERYPVEWEQVDTSLLAGPGEFVMEGEIVDENPLTGTWVEKGRIELPVDSFSLDARTFEQRGQRYLVWAQIIKDSNLYIAKMDTPWSICSEPVMITKPEYEWEIQRHRVNEGSAVLIRKGEGHGALIIEHLCPKSSAAR